MFFLLVARHGLDRSMEFTSPAGNYNLSAEMVAKILVVMTNMSAEDRQDAMLYWNTTVAATVTQAMQENDDFIKRLSPFLNMVCHQIRNSSPCRTEMIAVIGCDIKSVNFLDYNAMEPRFVNGMLLISDKTSDRYFSDVMSTQVVMSMWLNDFMSHLCFLTNKFYEQVFSGFDLSRACVGGASNADHPHTVETYFPSIVQWSMLRDSKESHGSQATKRTRHASKKAKVEVDSTAGLFVPVYEGPLSASDLLLVHKDGEEIDGPLWNIWSE